MPGIWASEYALPLLLLSFNGAGGILYGGLGIFVWSTAAVAAVVATTPTVDVDFNAVNLANALDEDVVDDDDDDDNAADNNGDGDGDCVDWLSNGLPVFTGATDSLPADKKND